MKSTENHNCKNCPVLGLSVFANMPVEILDQFYESKRCLQLKKNEHLFNEGDKPRGIYCVFQGQIKMSQFGIDGKEQIVHLARGGSSLGQRAFLAEEAYSVSAIALTEAEVCFIPRQKLESIVNSNPQLLWRLAKIVARDLRESETKITIMAQNTVKQRIKEVLNEIIATNGYKEDKRTINIKISRTELSHLAGTTRETLTRNLFQLQKEGYLTLVGKEILMICADD